MRVLIVEDEQLAAERLSQMIREYDSDIEILGPLDTVSETSEVLVQTSPDILFLDIQLADGKSFEIFDKVLYERPIIFTTAFDQYALRAFKLNSVDYLLKPIRPDELKQALDKFKRVNSSERNVSLSKDVIRELVRTIHNPYKKRFLVKQANKIFHKSVDDIAFVFAEGKLAYLVSREGRQFLIDHTLEELDEQLLDPLDFFRISRKHIIQVAAVQEVRNTGGKLWVKALGGQEELLVSRDRITEFKTWLNPELSLGKISNDRH